jgi:hypothetical protein
MFWTVRRASPAPLWYLHLLAMLWTVRRAMLAHSLVPALGGRLMQGRRRTSGFKCRRHCLYAEWHWWLHRYYLCDAANREAAMVAAATRLLPLRLHAASCRAANDCSSHETTVDANSIDGYTCVHLRSQRCYLCSAARRDAANDGSSHGAATVADWWPRVPACDAANDCSSLALLPMRTLLMTVSVAALVFTSVLLVRRRQRESRQQPRGYYREELH